MAICGYRCSFNGIIPAGAGMLRGDSLAGGVGNGVQPFRLHHSRQRQGGGGRGSGGGQVLICGVHGSSCQLSTCQELGSGRPQLV